MVLFKLGDMLIFPLFPYKHEGKIILLFQNYSGHDNCNSQSSNMLKTLKMAQNIL